MPTNDINLMQSYIDKRHRVFKVLLAVLTAVELVLIIRGLVFFDLEKLKLKLYLYSYVFLFVSSLVALVVLLVCKDYKKCIRKLTATVYIYAFCLIMWSAVVTVIDCYANGDSGIIVYVMTCISAGVLTLINPSVFMAYISVSGAFVLVATSIMRGGQLYSGGFYINFIIFVALAIFINIHNYHLSKREYEAKKELELLSYTDQLTRVRNRRGFDEHIRRNINASKSFVLALLDVDDLKHINDNNGHQAGDRCLTALTEKLMEYFGEDVYRVGGDEFAVISDSEAKLLSLQLDDINRDIGSVIGEDISLQISAGIYTVSANDTPSEVLSRVDEALYSAKRSGKARWIIYGEDIFKRQDEASNAEAAQPDMPSINTGVIESLNDIVPLLAIYDKITGEFTYRGDIIEYFGASPENMKLWDFLETHGITSAEDARAIKDVVFLLNERNCVFYNVYSFGVKGRHILSFTYLEDKIIILMKLFDQGDLDSETIKYDELTRLISRNHFCREIAKLNEINSETAYALFFFDIVKFKAINDIFGFKEGDAFLVYIAERLKNGRLPVASACRVSADRFAFLADVTEMRAEDIANALLEDIRNYRIPFEVLINIGVYIVPKTELSGDAMLDRAILAQEAIKGSYSNRISFYDDDLRDAMLSEQEIFSDMNNALAQEQFVVYYQPQYNHSTGMLVGAEALVRWQHPIKGMISPGRFIPIFEKNGFITKLDLYVFEQVAKFLRRSFDKNYSTVPISVNFSKNDIFSPDFVDTLEVIRKKYDIPAKYLRIEITESILVGNSKAVNEIIERLRELGYTIEMDDFGSGYSSLNVLKDLDFDVIKLDMLFLEGQGKNSRGGTILASVVNMAKWLRLPIIAEGVETIEQADFLKSIGCNFIQGYLYSKPLPEAEYIELVSRSHIGALIPQMNLNEKFNSVNFWEPSSQETLIFSNFVGAAAIFNFNRTTKQVDILRVNKKYLHELGMNLSEWDIIHQNPMDTLNEENKKVYIETLERAIETGEEQECETWREISSDCCGVENFYIRSTMMAIGELNDQILFYCMIRNITSEKNEYSSMLDSEKRFKMASEQVNIYFWEYTIATHEMRPCFRCMRDLGLPPLLRNYPDSAIERGIFPPEVADMYRDWHIQIANGVRELEAIIPLTPDRIPFRVRYTTEFDENGHPVKAYGSAALVVE